MLNGSSKVAGIGCHVRGPLAGRLNTEVHCDGVTSESVRYESQYKINKEFAALPDDLQQNFEVQRAMDALFLKREAFDHEAEFRVLLHAPEANRKSVREGIKIPINPHRLIDSVLLDPRAPPELVAAFTYYLQQKIGFKKRVARSVLYKSTDPYVVEGE